MLYVSLQTVYNGVRHVRMHFSLLDQNRCAMKTPTLVYALLSVMLLSSCAIGGSTAPTSTPVDIGAIQTSAVQTIIAPITQTAAAYTPPPADTEAPTDTPAPTASTTPAGTSTPTTCDNLQFISDSTVPDGTQIAAGLTFVKTWKIKNTGSCTWKTNYTIIWGWGDNKMGGLTTSLPSDVPPNTDVEISVTLKAPTKAGTYHSYWRLQNNNGYRFGTALSVVIVVP